VAFGDSLLDVGAYLPFAEAKFDGGRFTTNPGMIFAHDVACYFGYDLKPAFVGGFGLPLVPAGGLDYAQGGSRVTLQPGVGHAASGSPNADFEQQTTIPVKDQLALYLLVHQRFDSHQLVFINGGANDIFFNLTEAQAAGTAAAQATSETAIAQAASDLAKIVNEVLKNGATHVVLLNMPDLGMVPQGISSTDHGQTFTQMSQLFNTTLQGALQQKGIIDKIVFIDVFKFIDGIIADFQANGFTVSNTGTACNLPVQVAKATALNLNNPTQFGESLFCSPETFTSEGADQTFMFADTVHPTTHLSSLFAEFVERQLEAKASLK
jgi:phospholipase/lecithinase/hemolysin